jgi:uncharacterized membrane protein YadS
LLRTANLPFGLQLTSSQIIEIGGGGLGIVAATVRACFAFTILIGELLDVEPKLAQLIASICGASAVIATNTVTNAHDEHVAYAVACLTVFGSVAMFAYPIPPMPMHGLSPRRHSFRLHWPRWAWKLTSSN